MLGAVECSEMHRVSNQTRGGEAFIVILNSGQATASQKRSFEEEIAVHRAMFSPSAVLAPLRRTVRGEEVVSVVDGVTRDGDRYYCLNLRDVGGPPRTQTEPATSRRSQGGS